METVSSAATVRLSGLKDWMSALLVKQGMFAAEAEIVALRLIESELMGRPAGGVRWLPRLVAAMDVGEIDPRAQRVTIVDLPALLIIDGGTGVGQVTLTHALQHAVKKAEAAGSATVVLRNSRPLGDPTACLAVATSQGCVVGILSTCKRENEPWPIGPSEIWAWPGNDQPLVTGAVAAAHQDFIADALAAGLGGTKSSAMKKRLFSDDAEAVCFLAKVSAITELERFHQVSGRAMERWTPAAWIFDPQAWPDSVALSADAVGELRELAKNSRIAADW